jgi:capsule assembly protein Wzi
MYCRCTMLQAIGGLLFSSTNGRSARVTRLLRRHGRRVLHCVILACFAFVSGALLCSPSNSEQKVHARGPVYVPLDSWIYPVLRRLAAMGYAPDEESLTAPWTRRQCLMLVEEAADIASRRSTKVSAGRANEEALALIGALRAEFSGQAERPESASIESIYTRYTHIAGAPLRDSYHFGQSIPDDFGRPSDNGPNSVTGFSAFGTFNRFSGYFRGEYQQAGGRGPYSEDVRRFVAESDGIPLQPSLAVRGTNKFDPLEMYIGAQLGIFDITAGMQSFWWGPGEASAFHFSNNAEPMYALRVAQARPVLLPGPLRVLGRIRTQFLFGRLSGHQYPPRPFINAQKITFQLTQDLELGFTRSSIFGGVGHPLTAGSLWRSLFSGSSSGSTAFGARNDPGDRRSGFDFRWHLPGLRRYVTIYSDSLADDEPNPLANPHRSAWGPGIYISHFPQIQKLDLRVETYSTWLYRKDEGGRFIYWNDQYHDAYTNNGNLLGSWVGRDARAYSASSTYWWSAQNKLGASFRQTKAGSRFLPGGGTQTDVALNLQWQLRPELLANGFIQYERYFVPVLGGPRRDFVAGMQFTFYPKHWSIKR